MFWKESTAKDQRSHFQRRSSQEVVGDNVLNATTATICISERSSSQQCIRRFAIQTILELQPAVYPWMTSWELLHTSASAIGYLAGGGMRVTRIRIYLISPRSVSNIRILKSSISFGYGVLRSSLSKHDFHHISARLDFSANLQILPAP